MTSTAIACDVLNRQNLETVKIMCNADIANHFLDFGVVASVDNVYTLTQAGLRNLRFAFSDGCLDSSYEYCLVGAFTTIPIQVLRLNQYPADLRKAVLASNKCNLSYVAPTPVQQSLSATVVCLSNTSEIVQDIARSLGYADAVDIYNRF